MPRSRLLLTSLLALAAVALSVRPARAAAFSADFVTTGPKASATGTVYVSGRNVREETTVGARRTVMIINWNRKMLWYLDPVAKTYWGQAQSERALADQLQALKGKTPAGAAAGATRPGLKVTRRGTETVSGYRCEKTVTQGTGLKTTIWFSRKLDWPLKTETILSSGTTPQTTRTEYKSIKLHKPPASLFEPPKDYRQVAPPWTKTPAAGRREAGPGRSAPGSRGPVPGPRRAPARQGT